MSVTWQDIGTIVSIVGALLGAAVIYLRLAIRTECTDMRDKVMASVRADFIQRDIGELHIKGLNDNIASLWGSIRQIERSMREIERAVGRSFSRKPPHDADDNRSNG